MTIDHFEPINSLDEANQVAINQEMAIRVQPNAPEATEFFFVENDEWNKQVCGHRVTSTVSADSVRTAVQDAIDSENAMAVNKSLTDKYV